MEWLASALLSERKGEQAHRQAVAMGLKYKGFGYWVDPSTGEVTHKTENDQLVEVEPDVESDKWNGPSGKDQMTPNPDARGSKVPGSFGAMQANMQQAAGMGQNVGTAEPGQELVPPEEKNAKWDPGPDGNTCVGNDASAVPESPPQDAFVGKTNYYDWQAGPDGTNYTNLSFDKFLSHIKKPETPENPPEMGEMEQEEIIPMSYSLFISEQGRVLPGEPDKIAASNNWTPDRFGWYRDGSGQVVARQVSGQMVVYDDQMPGHTGSGAAVDQGNPAMASGQSPADRARAAGLQSRGNGTYVNDAGQVGARTVNGELVFYDDGASGGAVTDGAGGQQMVQSQPSWVDPDSGLIIVPPAQPESPGELAATPDPIPATTPHGYNSFIDKRHKDLKRKAQIQRDIEQESQEKREKLETTYQSNPNLELTYKKIQTIIQGAQATGDDKKSDIAGRVQQKVEERAEEFADMFDIVGDEYHEELMDLIPKTLVQSAKYDYFVDNMLDPIENDESLSDEEKAEQTLIAFADPDHGKKHFAKLSERETRMRELYNSAINARNNYEESTERVEGEMVNYDVTIRNDPTRDSNDKYPADYTTKNKRSLMSAAKKEGKKYGVEPGQIKQISWSNKDDEIDDADMRRRVAIDALKTWRSQILPSLEPGTIVYNDPQYGGRGDNQRERIYGLAGFGPRSDKYNGQYGLVIQQNGTNAVVPLFGANDKKDKKKKLKEQVMMALDYDFDDTESKSIYECLFT